MRSNVVVAVYVNQLQGRSGTIRPRGPAVRVPVFHRIHVAAVPIDQANHRILVAQVARPGPEDGRKTVGGLEQARVRCHHQKRTRQHRRPNREVEQGFIHQLPTRKIDCRVTPVIQFQIFQGDGIVVGTIHDFIDDHRRFRRQVRYIQRVEGQAIVRVHLPVSVAIITGSHIFERTRGGHGGAGDSVVIDRGGETGRARV